jgi:CRP-like cAMP-binding protein
MPPATRFLIGIKAAQLQSAIVHVAIVQAKALGMTAAPANFTNKILKYMSPAVLVRVRPALQRVNTRYGQVLHNGEAKSEHMYFVERGLVSLVRKMRDGRTVEIAAIGVEGMTLPNTPLGIADAELDAVVQIPGVVYRLRTNILRDEFARNEALQRQILRYSRFAIEQIFQTAACNRLHSLEERVCRWLLIAHDSALADTFPLTHEFLAAMLGVQRPGCSLAANALKKAGLIDYRRGRVQIIDRIGLEQKSCECYGTIRTELDKVFPAQEVNRNSLTTDGESADSASVAA